MESHSHRPYYRGHEARCIDCGAFLFDVRTGARLRALEDVDPVRLAAVERRFSTDPELARRLATEDMREVVSTFKLSDKLHDFLMNPKSRPDLQTPEAQHFLRTLKRWHNQKTDPLMPWLAREWKKGRIRSEPIREGDSIHDLKFEGGPDYEHEGGRFHRLSPAELEHWADWYGSDHPSRQGRDIMQMKSPELHQTIKDWDADMLSKAQDAAQTRGNVEHHYPDGWTMQRLTTPEQLSDEGDSMGHCVGGYHQYVRDGKSIIYSLRDQHNQPHVTMEIKPRYRETPHGLYDAATNKPVNGEKAPPQMWDIDRHPPIPHHGEVVQIQGKGNKPPVEDYQKRVKDFFEKKIPKEEDRPRWGDQQASNADEFMDPYERGEDGFGGGFSYYHPGDYGLPEPKIHYDWPEIFESNEHGRNYEPFDAESMFKRGRDLGVMDEMLPGAETYLKHLKEDKQDQQMKDWEDWEEMNYDYLHNEPMPESHEYDSPKDYDDAYNAWQKVEDENTKWAYEDWEREWINNNWQERQWEDELETQVAKQKKAEEEGMGSVTTKIAHTRIPHANYSTGEPCFCTFNKNPKAQWHVGVFMDKEPDTCPTCGDPLQHGQCQRCDWGQWSNAMGPGDLNPEDPTKEMHPGIQA